MAGEMVERAAILGLVVLVAGALFTMRFGDGHVIYWRLGDVGLWIGKVNVVAWDGNDIDGRDGYGLALTRGGNGFEPNDWRFVVQPYPAAVSWQRLNQTAWTVSSWRGWQTRHMVFHPWELNLHYAAKKPT